MTVTVTKDDIREQVLAAAAAAASKKATDIVILDVGDIIAITDFFVIASANNERLVKTVMEEVEEQLRARHGLDPRAVEGVGERRWVLMDYGDFFVHVFHQETRAYFGLERLWSDAPRIDFDEAAFDGDSIPGEPEGGIVDGLDGIAGEGAAAG